jgi:1,4-alpha-glucan branching enzyme
VIFPELTCVTPGEYIDQANIIQKNEIPFSSWGTKGFAEVWLDGKNDLGLPAYPQAH